MFGRQLRRLNLPTCQYSGRFNFPNLKCLRFMSELDAPDPNEPETVSRSLKQWRPYYDSTHKLSTKLKVFDRGGRPSTDLIVLLNGPWDLSRSGITRWWKKKTREMLIHDQRFIKERHEILGSNLAAAHFMVFRGGRIKFAGHPDWVEKDKDDKYDLPGRYQPHYLVEAIDARGIDLFYEGLLNLQHLYNLKFLSFKGCETIDDWCLDRISSQFPRVEHLDISNCNKVTERGLEALYRMHSLKSLIVTNWYKSPAFELTCLMLEDCIPNLRCEIKLPEKESEQGKLMEKENET